MIRRYLKWRRELWRQQRAERRAYRTWARRRLALAKRAYAEGVRVTDHEFNELERLYQIFRAARSARMTHEGWVP